MVGTPDGDFWKGDWRYFLEEVKSHLRPEKQVGVVQGAGCGVWEGVFGQRDLLVLRPSEASATEVSRETWKVCRVAGAELEAGKERGEMWGAGGS